MTRTLKFRVWHILEKRMITPTNTDEMKTAVALSCTPVGLIAYTAEKGVRRTIETTYTPEDFAVMQWTGLTDKNGVDIYEDDLVMNSSGRIMRVVWLCNPSNACWDLNVVSAVGEAPNHHRPWADLEVIGNVYTRPDLVEAK